MVEKFTVAELAKELNISTTAVYKKVDKKQFETIQEMVGTREITFIILTKEQLIKLKDDVNSNKVGFKQLNESFESNHLAPMNIKNQSEQINLTEKVIELTQTLSNQFDTYSKQLVEYAEKAGQVKLLTDNLSQEKKDLEFYKNEYFKLKYENEQLTKVNIDLQEKLNKKSFFGIFKK